VDERVDVVVLRHARPGELQVLRNRQHLHARRDALEPRGDERLAARRSRGLPSSDTFTAPSLLLMNTVSA
jgi:hypothetical protein